ncbi:MAG: M14 family zinc carboxypeptidase [Planctomycetota bacterium]
MFAAISTAVLGCAAPQRSERDAQASECERQRASEQSWSPQVVEIGRSVQNRPIEMHIFGRGPVALLVFACIHGDEIGARAVADGLVEELTRERFNLSRRILVIPVASPDGVARGSRKNSRSVDLNRNFPAKNWEPGVGRQYGTRPASEPETRALIQVIEDYEPAFIISIHSITGGRECNNFDGPAEHLANVLHQHNGYRITPSIGYPTPGSFGSWAGHDRGLPVVTLELPRGLIGKAAWIAQRDALMAAVDWAMSQASSK